MMKKLVHILFLSIAAMLPLQAATYYVSSSSGSDTNTGTSSSAPRKTLAGLTGKKTGNTILLKRGDIFFESMSGFSNCTIGAYGSGDKPVLCGFTILRGNSSWTQESAGIWKLDMNTSASFYGHGCNAANKYYGNIGTIYDPATDTVYGNLVSSASELSSEGDFFTSGEWAPGNITSSTYRYLRMKSASRPGALCFATYEEAITSMTNCTISDIAIVGFGGNGINEITGCTITGCDLDIIGGSIQIGTRTSWARYGNGIQCWISTSPNNNNTISNCQITRVYDTATTIQGNSVNGSHPTNINFTANRIGWCRQGFEQWTSTDGAPVVFENCSFSNNTLFCCGENKFTGSSARTTDVAFLAYRSPSAAITVSGNLVYGSNYRYFQENVGGFSGNEVYLVNNGYILYYYLAGVANDKIYPTADVQTVLYKKFTGDTSSITIVTSGSSADTAAKNTVLSALAYVSPVPSATEFEAYK